MSTSFLSTGLFGDLFRDPDIAGLFEASAFCDQMVRFEMAWTRALAQTGQITQDDAKAACAAMVDFTPDIAQLGTASDLDGLPVPELVRQIKGHTPAGAVHTGSTSQDVIDTAMVLTIRAALADIGTRLDGLIRDIGQLNVAHGHAQLMGRTRMQAALPIRAGQRIEAWRKPLESCAARLPDVTCAVSRVQIGGPVGAHPGGAFAQHVAKELELRDCGVWHTDRAAYGDLGHWLTTLSGHLGKLGTDITLMAQQGVDEIGLSGGGGSSAMPHKQNPVRAEALVTLARYSANLQALMLGALVHEQERSGSAWALEWIALPQLLELTGASLRHAIALTSQITRIGRS